jgi:hypothetical protein
MLHTASVLHVSKVVLDGLLYDLRERVFFIVASIARQEVFS